MSPLTPPPDGEAPTPFLGESEAVRRLWQNVQRIAPLRFPVRIEGESGTGKSVVAAALHRENDERRRGPFLEQSIPMLAPGLVVAQLVGYARGAFTGALCDTPGVFEQAHAGTLFLDEIGEAGADVQRALLTLVEARSVTRIGERRPRHVDVRLVVATNRRLDADVSAGTFRDDLLHRLAALTIDMPPLRERMEDLALILPRILQQIARHCGPVTLDDRSMQAILRYDWPGNIRQLENALIHYGVHGVLPRVVLDSQRRHWRGDLLAALQRNDGNRTRTAKELGISRETLYQELRRQQ